MVAVEVGGVGRFKTTRNVVQPVYMYDFPSRRPAVWVRDSALGLSKLVDANAPRLTTDKDSSVKKAATRLIGSGVSDGYMRQPTGADRGLLRTLKAGRSRRSGSAVAKCGAPSDGDRHF